MADPESGSAPESVVRKLLPFTTVAIIIVALYVAWTFYSRWNAGQEAQRSQSARETADAKKTLELTGNGEFKILDFYASPGAIQRGGQANICYGVSGAKSVRMEPATEPIRPLYSHCLQVSPKASTEYKLIAEDGKGHTAQQSFTLQVVK